MPNIDAQDFVIVESDGGLFSWLAQQKSLGDVPTATQLVPHTRVGAQERLNSALVEDVLPISTILSYK
jgi:hypothetical protein